VLIEPLAEAEKLGQGAAEEEADLADHVPVIEGNPKVLEAVRSRHPSSALAHTLAAWSPPLPQTKHGTSYVD